MKNKTDKKYIAYKVKDISLADWGRKRNKTCRSRDARLNGFKR